MNLAVEQFLGDSRQPLGHSHGRQIFMLLDGDVVRVHRRVLQKLGGLGKRPHQGRVNLEMTQRNAPSIAV